MEWSSPRWSWREGFQFALCWQLKAKDAAALPCPMNFAEKWGLRIVTPLHKTLDWCSFRLRQPLVIVLLTLAVALLCCAVFYNIPVWVFLGKVFPAKLIRFCLFLYLELLCLGMGITAFGRFHNQTLVKHWKAGKLISIFPGNKESIS